MTGGDISACWLSVYCRGGLSKPIWLAVSLDREWPVRMHDFSRAGSGRRDEVPGGGTDCTWYNLQGARVMKKTVVRTFVQRESDCLEVFLESQIPWRFRVPRGSYLCLLA